MRRKLSFLVLLVYFSAIQCDILTDAENKERLNQCGKQFTSKVFSGRRAQQSEAPWSVFIKNGYPQATVCTGTLISSRHVLTATHCFAQLSAHGWTTIQHGTHDASNCRGTRGGGSYVIDDRRVLDGITVDAGGATRVADRPERVTLIRACGRREPVAPGQDVQQLYEDIAIIDLYEDVVFSTTLQPACTSVNPDDHKVGTSLEYFGYGIDPPLVDPPSDTPPADTSGVLRHETLRTLVLRLRVPLPAHYFLARDPTSKTVACSGDSGGGAVRRRHADGRHTVVGVLSQTSCASGERASPKTMEMYSSVAYYQTDICEVSGVCEMSQHVQVHPNYQRKPKPIRPSSTPSPELAEQNVVVSDKKIPPLGDISPNVHLAASILIYLSLLHLF